MFYNQKLGKWGQEIAIKYLQAKGYKIIRENIYHRQGEIDILAIKDGVWRFIEVKTRSNLKFGEPIQSVSDRKRKHLQNFIDGYVLKNGIKKDYRLEFVFILWDQKNNKAKARHLDNIC